MHLIDGRKIAQEILAGLKEEIREKKIEPCLAVILVGEDKASRLYVRLKTKAAQSIGVEVREHSLAESVSENEVLELIQKLNQDKKVHGILVQLPLPQKFCADTIIQAISPEKDVDGFLAQSKFDSPFVLSIWRAIEATGEDLQNKNIVALVNSEIFGKKLSVFFNKKGLKMEYYKDLDSGVAAIKNADIVIAALGLPNHIKDSMIKQGVILIDGGISQTDKKVVGDVDEQSVASKAQWLSPVPGGVGPMTVAYLLKNVVLAADENKKEGTI